MMLTDVAPLENAMAEGASRDPGGSPVAELMTLKEVAGYLRLSGQTLYKMVKQGQIPVLKVGSRWRFRKAEVDEWMRKRATSVQAAPQAHQKRGSQRSEYR